MTPSAPLSHVNYKVVHNIIRMLIHGFCMNGEIICFEVPIWDAFEVSFDHFFFSLCKFVKSVGENGTPVWKVPVHLKASVLNSGSCLLPATSASSETLLCGEGLKTGKGVYCKACACPECVCACRGTYLHTHVPPGGQLMGMFMGKDSGRLVLLLLGTKRSSTNFSFARSTTSHQRRKTPMSPLLCGGFAKAASCLRSSLQQHPAWEHRDSGNYRWAGCCALLCAQIREPGHWCVRSHSLAWSCCTCLRVWAVSVRNRLHLLPYKSFSPSKKRSQRRQWCWRKRNSASVVQFKMP